MNILAIYRTINGRVERKGFFDLYSMKEYLSSKGYSLVKYETKPLTFAF